MQKKTTRAFRTISEAGDELDLQPHVLRFWESKFPQIKPIKRGGGRRFYRPEDIEFLRGIKILLHDEKHPIKDVQKLIRVKGPQRVIELGQSVEKASKHKEVSETVLIPKRIADAGVSGKVILETPFENVDAKTEVEIPSPAEEALNLGRVMDTMKADDKRIVPFLPKRTLAASKGASKNESSNTPLSRSAQVAAGGDVKGGLSDGNDTVDREKLEDALQRLLSLRSRWVAFRESSELS